MLRQRRHGRAVRGECARQLPALRPPRPQSAPRPAAEAPITTKGPSGWDRGPYDLAGGNYRLDWTSDGTCSALYFGIVGVSNGYVETPPTAGDVTLKDMKQGSRVIENVPPGSYYFNVSGVACKSYSATLSQA